MLDTVLLNVSLTLSHRIFTTTLGGRYNFFSIYGRGDKFGEIKKLFRSHTASKWQSGEWNCVCLIRALPTLLCCHMLKMTPASYRGIYRFELLPVQFYLQAIDVTNRM